MKIEEEGSFMGVSGLRMSIIMMRDSNTLP